MNVAPITTTGPAAGAAAAESAPQASGGQAFGALVDQLLTGQAEANAAADRAVQALAVGQADSLHAVGLAVAQADLSFRLILEMRNRLTEAYQEVLRMQV